MPYVLEAQKFIPKTGFLHVGYVDKIFKTKKQASDYYDKYHVPPMRSLNAHKSWCSDWHPETRLRYVVRVFDGECRSIPPFEQADGDNIDEPESMSSQRDVCKVVKKRKKY